MATTICVDGPIGMGKSTLIKRLVDHPEIVCAVLGENKFIVPVLEPVDAWIAAGTFQLMCTNPSEWALPFQHSAMVTRISHWTLLWKEHGDNPNAVLLLERAPHADKFVFTDAHVEHGHISVDEQEEHSRWWDIMWAKRPSEIERIGIIDGSVDLARKRIEARDRVNEDSYDWNYLSALHTRYKALRIECTPGVYSVHLDAQTAFHTCNEALLLAFARVCGETPTRHFVCTCGKCKSTD